MAAGLSRASKQENVSTTLSSGITDVAATMDVNDATKLNYPSYLVIDRVDAAGTLKSTSLWEYVKVTNIVGSTLTITRAQGGSTQQSHSSGAVVEAVMTAALQEEYYAAFNPEHTATGGHIMGQATIAYLENARMAVSSVASISILQTNTITATDHMILTPGTSKFVKIAVLRQNDTTNAYNNNTVILTGVGKITGDASASIAETVTFGITFDAAPIVFANAVGLVGTGAFNYAGITGTDIYYVNATGPGVGTVVIRLRRVDGSTFDISNDWYYTWMAIGTLA